MFKTKTKKNHQILFRRQKYERKIEQKLKKHINKWKTNWSRETTKFVIISFGLIYSNNSISSFIGYRKCIHIYIDIVLLLTSATLTQSHSLEPESVVVYHNTAGPVGDRNVVAKGYVWSCEWALNWWKIQLQLTGKVYPILPSWRHRQRIPMLSAAYPMALHICWTPLDRNPRHCSLPTSSTGRLQLKQSKITNTNIKQETQTHTHTHREKYQI